MNKKNKKSGGVSGVIAAIGVILLIRAFNYGERAMIAPAFMLLVLAGILGLIKLAVRKNMTGGMQKTDAAAGKSPAHDVRPTPTIQTSRPAPSMQRREPVTENRSFSKPDAYCVSCELSGEDHFVRDRNRRIAQLDEWLKNGLIDRQEYMVLKRRFQNDQ